MKKVFSILLALACLLTPLTTFAVDLEQDMIPQTKVAYLYDDEGNCVEVIGHLVEANPIHILSEDESTSLTYAFDLRATIFDSKLEQNPDAQNVSTVYSTISYYQDGSSYLLTSVAGSWTIYNSAASVRSAVVEYSCFSGESPAASGIRSVSNDFYIGTGFSTYVSGFGLTVGANLSLTYVMNSRTWTFTLPNFI